MMAAKVTTATQAAPALLGDFVEPNTLAGELGISPRTLARWTALRQGPPRVKVGKLVLFRKAAVLDWLQRNEQRTLRAR
jgi:predicted DNA-binding transcriptional regulator AlpA